MNNENSCHSNPTSSGRGRTGGRGRGRNAGGRGRSSNGPSGRSRSSGRGRPDGNGGRRSGSRSDDSLHGDRSKRMENGVPPGRGRSRGGGSSGEGSPGRSRGGGGGRPQGRQLACEPPSYIRPPRQRALPERPQPPKLKNGDMGADAHTVTEEYRIGLTRILFDLRENDEKELIEFPSTLTNTERKFVHELSGQLGLKSKSTGKGENRSITVTKPNQTAKSKMVNNTWPILRIGQKGLKALQRYMEKYPPTHTEELESHETGSSLVEALAAGQSDAIVTAQLNQLGLGVRDDAPTIQRREKRVDLSRRQAQHAKAQQKKQNNNAAFDKMLQIRSKLPAYQHELEIVRTVANTPVTIISGETGCGKSTQVPQFLLDANPTCSIVVTQPRRISAISIAERVVDEQCQGSAGGLIGYQVRLESAVTADTQLVFMTPGVLLRKMQSSPQFSEYTHIIVDEIHERDKYQEFLLIVLRDLLPLRTDLRVVLMSATLQTVALVDYFSAYGLQPAVVEMEGRMFPVQEFFLEQVLKMTGYIDVTTGYDGGVKLEEELSKLIGQTHGTHQTNVAYQCAMCGKEGFLNGTELGEHIALCDGFFAENSCDDELAQTYGDRSGGSSSTSLENSQASSKLKDCDVDVNLKFEEFDVDGRLELDKYDSEYVLQAAHSVTRSATDNAHAGSNVTSEPLVVADSDLIKWDGKSPFGVEIEDGVVPTQTEQALLDQYQTMHDDETVDNFLLLEVVQYIVKSSYGDGGVLIFLPGWQEISEFTLMLEGTAPFYDRSKFLILPLHSGIPSRDQRRVLQRPPRGVRKIVLSTNIAETSLTIDDVAFVVDTGRAKEKNYDPHLKTSTLQPTWISQASAKQRKGRAGRVRAGVCFHLFSSRRHQSMRAFTESELLRTPLEEMCLMCKQLDLAPGGPEDDDGVPAFLAKAMSAPHLKSISNALELLVDLGAMQLETNNLTTLGECLAVLSLEPRVGKMVIWSYLLGCARVASNMAVAMSHKSPFVLPRESQRKAADNAKLQISLNSESDQITIHNALEMRQQFKNEGAYNDFCRRNYIGMSTMQMISDLRQNLTRELTTLGFPNPSARNQYQNRHDNDHALWQAAIAAGLYPNIASRKQGDLNFTTMTGRKVKAHVSSVNAVRGQPLSSKCTIPEGEVEFVCFGEMVKGARIFTANQTTRLASPLPLLLLCGTLLSVHPLQGDDGNAILKLDDWIVFRCDAETAARIVVLRKRLDGSFWHALSNPSRNMLTYAEQDAVEVLGSVLQSAHRTAQGSR